MIIFSGFIGIIFIISNDGTSTGPTNVNGYLSSDTTWTLSNSPYIVNDHVIVEQDITLTIEKGVTVKFDTGKNLVIDGNLVANGSEKNKITFTSNDQDPKAESWGGITIREDSDDDICILDWCIVEYANIGISCNYSSPTISNCTISNNNIGILCNGGSVWIDGPMIKHNIISDNNEEGIYGDGDIIGGIHFTALGNKINRNNNGIYLRNTNYGRDTFILYNEISDNRNDGIIGDDKLIIKNNEIKNNMGNGISIDDQDITIISNRIIGNNLSGIKFGDERSSFTGAYNISYNEITGNKNNGLSANNAGGVIIEYNNIYDNEPYDFFVVGENDREAINNWWGTTDKNAISLNIYDYYDDYNMGKVNFEPYLKSKIIEFPDTNGIVTPGPNSNGLPDSDNDKTDKDKDGDGEDGFLSGFDATIFVAGMMVAIVILIKRKRLN